MNVAKCLLAVVRVVTVSTRGSVKDCQDDRKLFPGEVETAIDAPPKIRGTKLLNSAVATLPTVENGAAEVYAVVHRQGEYGWGVCKAGKIDCTDRFFGLAYKLVFLRRSRAEGFEVICEIEDLEGSKGLVFHLLNVVLVRETDESGDFFEGADRVRVRRLITGKDGEYGKDDRVGWIDK